MYNRFYKSKHGLATSILKLQFCAVLQYSQSGSLRYNRRIDARRWSGAANVAYIDAAVAGSVDDKLYLEHANREFRANSLRAVDNQHATVLGGDCVLMP